MTGGGAGARTAEKSSGDASGSSHVPLAWRNGILIPNSSCSARTARTDR